MPDYAGLWLVKSGYTGLGWEWGRVKRRYKAAKKEVRYIIKYNKCAAEDEHPQRIKQYIVSRSFKSVLPNHPDFAEYPIKQLYGLLLPFD